MNASAGLRLFAVACFSALASADATAGFLEDLACPLLGCADGPEPRLALDCRVLGLTQDPSYNKSPAWPVAAYEFRGVCSNADHSKSVSFSVLGIWAPGATDPGKHNASEVISITSNDRLSPDTRAQEGGAEYLERVIFKARCERDPWLAEANCTRMGDDAPIELHQTWGQLPTKRFPISRGVISTADRFIFKAASDAGFGTGNSDFRQESKPVRPSLPSDPYMDDSATEVASDSRHSAAIEAMREAAKPDPPICASARSARARNSPAAPGLARQCVQAGGTL